MIFQTPELTLEDRMVLDEIHTTRSELADFLRAPRRWTGGLRRHALAAAIRGSNSIEGYIVDVDDAAAAVDGEEPLIADEQTFAEIRGYRQTLGYVLAMSADEHFLLDASAIRGQPVAHRLHHLAVGRLARRCRNSR